MIQCIMIGVATNENTLNQQMVHLYVSDVDSGYKRALGYGCEPIQKPDVKEANENKRDGFRDFAGNGCWITTQIGKE